MIYTAYLANLANLAYSAYVSYSRYFTYDIYCIHATYLISDMLVLRQEEEDQVQTALYEDIQCFPIQF